MKIFCICIAKDEDDVLRESITEASRWADRIFIADNNSTDNTPQIIHELSVEYGNVVDIGPFHEPFSYELRAKMYKKVAQVSSLGDWWCRLDADEIYIDNPKMFLSGLPDHVDFVWGSSFQFRFTERDLEAYESDPKRFLSTPVQNRLKYYKNDWSEPRFAKHTFPFIWYGGWPYFRCSSSPKRIRLRHYQYRSPEQIIKRLICRKKAFEQSKGKNFKHELSRSQKEKIGAANWQKSSIKEIIDDCDYKERIFDSNRLDYYTGGVFVERENELPEITRIKPQLIPANGYIWRICCLLVHYFNAIKQKLKK